MDMMLCFNFQVAHVLLLLSWFNYLALPYATATGYNKNPYTNHSTQIILNARGIDIIFGLKLGTISKLRETRPYDERQDGPYAAGEG